MLIIKCALTAPSMLRLGSLQWVLMGTPEEIEGRHRKVILGTHQVWRITLEQGASDPKENCVSILFSRRVHPSLEAHPNPSGWLAFRGQGHRLTGATFAAADLARLRRS